MSNEKIQVKITGVNQEAEVIKYIIEGKEHVSTVIPPADIKYARIGDAEVQLNEAGYVCYIRAIKKNAFTPNNFDKEKTNYATSKPSKGSTMKAVENLTAQEVAGVYNELSTQKNVVASNIFQNKDGTYTIFMFYKEAY